MTLHACVHSCTLHVRCVPVGFIREGSQTISLRAESHGMSSRSRFDVKKTQGNVGDLHAKGYVNLPYIRATDGLGGSCAQREA